MIDRTLKTFPTEQTPSFYKSSLAGFVVFLAITLLAIVDFRRGFLFTDYMRTPYSAYHPIQPAMLILGVGGMFLCYSLIKSLEEYQTIPDRYAKLIAFSVFGLLVIDLLTYRAVPTVRAVASGKLNADWLQAFGVIGWMKPVALSVSYLFTVWHATLLGVLIAGLALTALPKYLKPLFSRSGWAGTLLGAFYALPQPFCSCCAAAMTPSYTRRDASTNFTLSFVVGSPMLNITTMILAFTLLPIQFAVTRIAAGLVLTILVTHGVVRLAERWDRPENTPFTLQTPPSLNLVSDWISRWTNFYLRMFNVDALVKDRKTDTPAELVSTWLYASARLALILVPTLFLWSIITAAIIQILSSAVSNSLPSVVLMAITGTLLMISTWTEIPVALQLIQAGFPGPAATLLVVLPPVSLPCLMLLCGSLHRSRITILLAVAVMLVGVIAGVIFL